MIIKTSNYSIDKNANVAEQNIEMLDEYSLIVLFSKTTKNIY